MNISKVKWSFPPEQEVSKQIRGAKCAVKRSFVKEDASEGDLHDILQEFWDSGLQDIEITVSGKEPKES